MTDDEEDEDERTQQRGSPLIASRPVAATFRGKRLEPPPVVRADPSAMAMMKKGALEIRTPELALNPHSLATARPSAADEDTAPTMHFFPEAQITVHEEEPDTITKREALSDADIVTTPSALSEPDSITPQASTNVLELLKRVARPTGDLVEAPARLPQHTLPLVHEAPDRTLPLPKDAPVIDKTMLIPKEEKRIVAEALQQAKSAPLPAPAPVITKPKQRRRWPIILVLLLLIGGGIAAWQSPLARSKVSETIAKIRR